MPVSVQNRSVLYGTMSTDRRGNGSRPLYGVVPEGIHEAKLAEVRRFSNAFGERVGLVFEVLGGPYAGVRVMEAAALKSSPRGKLAELVRGMGGEGGSLLAATELVGQGCRIVIRHETTRAGQRYAAVTQTLK